MATLPNTTTSTARGSKTTRWLISSLLLAILATWLAYQQVDRPLTGIDDANIFLTYGQHLSQGEGFVYYRGGERVEGFTSLLWTIICSLCFLLSSHPEPLLLGINVALLGSTIYLVIRFLQVDVPPSESPTAGPAYHATLSFLVMPVLAWGWCLLNPKFVIWTTITLMDIGLWCFVLTSGTLSFARAASRHQPLSRSTSCSLCGHLALALLTRPEAMLIGLVWLSGLLLGRHLSRRLGGDKPTSFALAIRDCLAPTIAYLLILGSLTTFRLSYFGYPLPNTFYAKVSPDLFYNLKLGLGYLRGFFFSQFWAIVCCTVAGVRTCRMLAACTGWIKSPRFVPRSEHALVVDLVSLTAIAAISASVLTGGDHFALYRFFQPIWPLLLIAGILPLFQWAAVRLASRPKWLAPLILGILLSTFYSLQSPWWNQIGSDIQVEFDFARSGRQLGNQLNELFPADQEVSLGIITSGGIGFAYQGPLLDLMGLNNVSMGHSPGDRRGNKNHAAFNTDVFFQLSPDLVDPRLVGRKTALQFRQDLVPAAGSFWDGALQQVHQSDQFQQTYRAALITGPQQDQGRSWQISAWIKPAIITRLIQQGIQVQLLPGGGEERDVPN